MKIQEIKDYLDYYSGLDISKKCREEIYVKMRAHYVGVVKYCTGVYSDKYCGSFIGLDHAGVINARKTLEAFLFSDKQFNAEHAEILSHVKSKSSKSFVIFVDNVHKSTDERLKKRVIKLHLSNKQNSELKNFYKVKNKKLRDKIKQLENK